MYLKILIVAVPLTTTVTAIFRAQCLGKQKCRNYLTSECEGSASGTDLWVFGCSPGCDRLSDLVGYERKGVPQPQNAFPYRGRSLQYMPYKQRYCALVFSEVWNPVASKSAW